MNHNYTFINFDEIDSTNSEAIRLAKAKVSKNYVIIAKTQTLGRGRGNKNWYSPRGNLYATLLLKFYKDPEFLPLSSFIAALAVYDCVEALKKDNSAACNTISDSPGEVIINKLMLSDPCISIKWPNDILVNNKKIAGVLPESIKVSDSNYLIIGVGININHHPINIDQITTSLVAENFQSSTAEEILEFFVKNFEKYYQMWLHKGFLPIRDLWLKRAYKLHKTISVKINKDIVTGIFQDIDDTGRIIIEVPNKKILSLSVAEFLE